MAANDDVADVLIIGGCASGSVAAKHLSEAGFKVVVLEQGDWFAATSDLPGNKPEHELLGSRDWSPNPNERGWRQDYPTNLDSEQPVFMYAGVDGSTVFFAGVWNRPLPSDFRVRTLDGVADDWPLTVADDWPLTYEDLLP